MASNKRINKAYVRYDGSGRVIPGSLILNRFKPKVGNWQETPAYLCCNPASVSSFDITADWTKTIPAVVDEATFIQFLETGEDGGGEINSFLNVSVTDFVFTDLGNGYQRVQCSLTADANPTNSYEVYFTYMDIIDIKGVGNIQNVEYLYLTDNLLTEFNPAYALPSSLIQLYLNYNQLTTFAPTLPLPSSLSILEFTSNQLSSLSMDALVASLPNSLTRLDLAANPIITFNPNVALPSSLLELSLNVAQIVTFNPTIALPSSLQLLGLNLNSIVSFSPTVALPTSINLLDLSYNQMTTAGYTASESWANSLTVVPGRGEFRVDNNINSISGTTLETILISKGWTVTA